MRIPLLNLSRLHASIRSEIDAALGEVVDNATFIGGEAVAEFEAEFARAHGRAGGAGCGSGTDALHLALRGLGIGSGHEVIVPAMTFVATAEAVLHAGATPVVVDVDPATLLINFGSVERAVTPKTKAVLPVHLYGNMVSPSVLSSMRSIGLAVIEDAAQAHLATFDGTQVGEVGDAACFSFYPGKNLGAFGDGGMVVSDSIGLLERVRSMRDHGRVSKHAHEVLGFCSRLDTLQAAVLSTKLRHLRQWNEMRHQVAAWYLERLRGSDLPVQVLAVHEGSALHQFVLRVPGDHRDQLLRWMWEQGIGCGAHYPIALSSQPSMKEYAPVRCGHAEAAARSIISLPMDPLIEETEVDAVLGALESYFRHTRAL